VSVVAQVKKMLRLQVEWQWVLTGVVGVVFGLGLWEVFPDSLGNGKPVTFYRFVYNLICKQIARTNMNAPFKQIYVSSR